jgi:hypothetical protein
MDIPKFLVMLIGVMTIAMVIVPIFTLIFMFVYGYTGCLLKAIVISFLPTPSSRNNPSDKAVNGTGDYSDARKSRIHIPNPVKYFRYLIYVQCRKCVIKNPPMVCHYKYTVTCPLDGHTCNLSASPLPEFDKSPASAIGGSTISTVLFSHDESTNNEHN